MNKVAGIDLSIEEFNNKYPIGTRVRYFDRENKIYKELETMTKAYDFIGIKGVHLTYGVGFYSFDNLEVVND